MTIIRLCLRCALPCCPVLELLFGICPSNTQWERSPGKHKTMFWRKSSAFCR